MFDLKYFDIHQIPDLKNFGDHQISDLHRFEVQHNSDLNHFGVCQISDMNYLPASANNFAAIAILPLPQANQRSIKEAPHSSVALHHLM